MQGGGAPLLALNSAASENEERPPLFDLSVNDRLGDVTGGALLSSSGVSNGSHIAVKVPVLCIDQVS